MEKSEIKTIEDLSLNAWPSHQMQLYDGWILRYSHFYTHRTNCVEQIGASMIPKDEKIAYCEEIYRRWKTPCIFKITPLTDPEMDGLLSERGYEIERVTNVMSCSLADAAQQDACRKAAADSRHEIQASGAAAAQITVDRRISDEWIDALFSIKQNATVVHLKIVPSMYAAIPKDVICVSARKDGRIVATGLGILDRDYIGIYAINVDKAFRRQGIARRICGTLLSEGRKAGADKAYLQVTAGNETAISLYQSLGFEKQYQYWFRVKQADRQSI